MKPRKQACDMTCTRPQATSQILVAMRASSRPDPEARKSFLGQVRSEYIGGVQFSAMQMLRQRSLASNRSLRPCAMASNTKESASIPQNMSGGRAKTSPMLGKASGECGVSALQLNKSSLFVSPVNFLFELSTFDRMFDVALDRVQFADPDLSQEYWCSMQHLFNQRSAMVCETKASEMP